MIHLSRDRAQHVIAGKKKYLIPGGLHGHHLRTKSRKLLDHRRDNGDFGSKDFKSTYWKPAKDQLRAEAHNKCAYCEAPTKVVAHGDVEHYRPKSEYWWLAYCYDNYLYSCQICNQVFKRDKFPVNGARLQAPPIDQHSTDETLEDWQTRLCPDPIRPAEGYTHAQYLADHEAERPLLLNPYLDEPEKHLAWKAIPALREVSLVPVEGDEFSARVVEAMEEYYGLNREELRKDRFEWYDPIELVVSTLGDAGTEPAVIADRKQRLKRFLEADCKYAGMIRYFVSEVWKVDLD